MWTEPVFDHIGKTESVSTYVSCLNIQAHTHTNARGKDRGGGGKEAQKMPTDSPESIISEDQYAD